MIAFSPQNRLAGFALTVMKKIPAVKASLAEILAFVMFAMKHLILEDILGGLWAGTTITSTPGLFTRT